jgi:hypothetical protein
MRRSASDLAKDGRGGIEMGIRHGLLTAFAIAATSGVQSLHAQQYEDVGGIRYQITRQEIPQQIAVPGTREQQVTTYRQQVTTENVQHQQVYHVPVTQYQVVSRLHGRWNPFVEPYWTHHYEPVTTWQQQVGTVQIPVQRVAVVPETRTVQQPVTNWQTATRVVESRIPIGPAPNGPGGNTAMAAAQPLSSAPTASLTPVQSPATRVASNAYGGQQLTNDPPKYGNAAANGNSGWQQPTTSAPQTQTATQPTVPPQTQSRY